MKKIRKFIISILSVILALFVLFLGVIYLTNYHPQPTESLTITRANNESLMLEDEKYTIMTWNTGYAALSKEQDFFMDGGTRSGAFNKDEVIRNSNAIKAFLENQNTDIILLQEVDISGKRSKNVNQYELYRNDNIYDSVFATNYKNLFVPVPLTSPMGNVHSGIMTLSKFEINQAHRVSLNGKENFLVQLFELERCFIVTRFPVGERELVLINTHLSAFDKGGKIREQQLAQLKTLLMEEVTLGNYVILGGDFNHELPGTSSDNFTWTVPLPDWVEKFPTDFDLHNYSWAVDPSVPTVRSNEQAYVKDENFVAIIDGFLVSNNIEIVEVKGIDLQFENSDHNPVILTFKLLPH